MCVVNILKSVNATPTVRIVLNNKKQIWKPKGKLSDNSLNKTKQIWKQKGKLSDNSLYKTKRVWKATGKLFADIGYQWRPTGKKLTLGKLDCGSQWRPTGKKFALGERYQFACVLDIRLSLPKSTLKLSNMRIMRDLKIQEEVHREVLSFLEIDWLAGHQRIKEALQYLQQRLNKLPCLDAVLKSFGCDHSSKTTDLTSIKFLCIVITKLQLLFAVTMSSTLDQSTSTYVTISSERKWKIEWLNSTLWKRTINLRTFSQKHYQENGSKFFFHV
ncbi:hypothetical protein Tco_1545358 [Tanacetum coccineum]